jgi:transporter family-2 protein
VWAAIEDCLFAAARRRLEINHGHREPRLGLQNAILAMLAMAAGSLFPIQTAANAQLARLVAGPIAATIISFTVGWFALLAINSAVFRQFPAVGDVVSAPLPLLLVGGVLGATFLSANVYLAPRLGAAATLCFVIAGQIVAAMIIDRFGLFDFAVRDLSPGRAIGVILVLAGAVLVRLT